jgi:SAM-dependent methyltransferase
MNELKSKIKDYSISELHTINLLLNKKDSFTGLILNSKSYIHFKMTKDSFDIIKEVNSNFTNFLIDSPAASFDFIHTSTVTDLQKDYNIDSFMQHIYRCLKRGGYVILKRAINNYSLLKKASEFFSTVEGVPKSELKSYLEVAVLYKI